MSITIYGTDWCSDTRRTRAFLAGRGVRTDFVDIEARPERAKDVLESFDGPVSIPIVVMGDGTTLVEPDEDALSVALSRQKLTTPTRHRTSLNRALQRFEQHCNDDLVATLDYAEDGDVVVLAHVQQHSPDAESHLLRLMAGVVEIISNAGRQVDPVAPLTRAYIEAEGLDELIVPRARDASTRPSSATPTVPEGPTCALSKTFSDLWSAGADHLAAVGLAAETGTGMLALTRALHDLWGLPLTAEALTSVLSQIDPRTEAHAAAHESFVWIVDRYRRETMQDLQSFDEQTGLSSKLMALARAGRDDDAKAFRHRMGIDLELRPLTHSEARMLAAAAIRESEGRLRLQDDSTQRHPWGWLFLYQSAEYLDTGNFSAMVSGNAPLLVDRFTGALWVTGTEERPNVYIESYEQFGDPLPEFADA